MGIGYLLMKPIKKVEEEVPWEPTGEIYGVDVLRFTSNSSNRVVYIDDAVDFIPARGNNGDFLYGSWENKFPFNRIRPCMVQNGAVRGYLKKEDFNYYTDGTIADIRNATQGDVMIEIPTIYYKFEGKPPTKDVLIRYSDTKHDDSWVAYAHTDSNGVVKDNLYIGAYFGSGTGSLMYSRSGQSPMVSKLWSEYTAYAENRGTGYTTIGHHQITLLQILFLVMFKSTDGYSVLGQGVQTGGAGTSGTTDTKGMFYGTDSRTDKVKFMGLEDFYGSVLQFIRGMYYASGHIYELDGVQVGTSSSQSGVMLDIEGTNTLGFIASESGSASTYAGLYWNSISTRYTTRHFEFGSASGTSTNRGPFAYIANITNTSKASNRGSRLMFL